MIPFVQQRVPDNRYQQYAPHMQLAPYVLCYWSMHTDARISAKTAVRVLPDGCIDAIFDPSGVLAPENMPHLARPGSFLTGIMDHGMVIQFNAPGTVLGIRFRPGGVGIFLDIHASETLNLRLELRDLLPRVDPLLNDTFTKEACYVPSAIAVLEQALLNRLPKLHALDTHAARTINILTKQTSAPSIASAARTLRVSTRTLERDFARHVGMPPRQFARIVRLQKTLQVLRTMPANTTQRPSWAQLAHDNGFADQSHFIRDIKSLSGITPSALLQEHADVAFVQYPISPFL